VRDSPVFGSLRSASRSTWLAGLALALCACATMPAASAHPEARLYAEKADAMADVEGALARSAVSGKRVLLVLGANWCHDSRALAGWLETPRFAALVAAHYEVVFVDVGMPQTGAGHNLDIAKRFGLGEVKNTPALLVLTPEGRAVNLDTARDWRNAASRSEEAIYAELAALAGPPVAAPSAPAATAATSADATDANVWVGSDGGECRFALSPEGP